MLGGSISDGGVRREFVVFAADTLGKANTIAEADPSVKSGRFTVDLHPWFAADGVMRAGKSVANSPRTMLRSGVDCTRRGGRRCLTF